MSAAYLHHLAGDRYEALSAGPEPTPGPGDEIIETMAEAGISLPDTPGTLLTARLVDASDLVIELGVRVDDSCPAVTTPVEDWGLPDPAGRRMDEVRIIRDTTKRLVERLIARLDTEATVS